MAGSDSGAPGDDAHLVCIGYGRIHVDCLERRIARQDLLATRTLGEAVQNDRHENARTPSAELTTAD